MKALVTGATGFIGSHIADLLLEKGFEVRSTIRKTSNLRWLKDKPVELVDASFSTKESLYEAVSGVDYIFHSAGLTFARNFDEFMKGNCDATRNLLEAVYEKNPNIKRFVHTSSLAAAGPSESLEKPIDESSECKPLTSYGKSKRASELEVLKMKDRLPVTIIRPPAVFGPRDTAILDIFKTVNSGLAPLMGFNKKYLSLIHSRDLSRGIYECIQTDKTIGNTYFISSGEFYTWTQLMELIKKAFNKKYLLTLRLPHFIVLAAAGISEFAGKFSSKPPVFNFEKGIDFIQNYWICSIKKAEKDFGYNQLVSIDEGIEETARWYKEQRWIK